MAKKYYCKYCGYEGLSPRWMETSECLRNPNGKHHELYEGSEKTKYRCKYCGNTSLSIATLTHKECRKNPNKVKGIGWCVPEL